jgi:hypothetical protein
MDAEETLCLLQLPDPCLLAILQCLEHDPVSLSAAARTHSRLHKLSQMVPRHIRRTIDEPEVDWLLKNLSKYGKNVQTLSLMGLLDDYDDGHPFLHELPTILHLTSLELTDFDLLLRPGKGYSGHGNRQKFEGVLGAASKSCAFMAVSFLMG